MLTLARIFAIEIIAMMFIRTVEIRAAVATLAITALFSASQVRAQSKAPDAAAQASPASALRSAAVPEASASPAPKKQTLGQEVKALVAKYLSLIHI